MLLPRPVLRLGAAAWLLLEGRLAVHTYFTTYRDGPIGAQFSDGLGEASAAVKGLKGLRQVRITDQVALPYVYTSFYLAYPPGFSAKRSSRCSVAPTRCGALGAMFLCPTCWPPGSPTAIYRAEMSFRTHPGGTARCQMAAR
jgi:hypothetical protein